MPNVATTTAAGNGPWSGVPSTSCLAVTGISCERPGRAESASIMAACFRVKSIARRRLDDRVPAPDPVRQPGVLDGIGVESHACLLEHASRCTVAQRGQAYNLGEPELACARNGQRRDLGRIASTPAIGSHGVQELDARA